MSVNAPEKVRVVSTYEVVNTVPAVADVALANANVPLGSPLPLSVSTRTTRLSTGAQSFLIANFRVDALMPFHITLNDIRVFDAVFHIVLSTGVELAMNP